MEIAAVLRTDKDSPVNDSQATILNNDKTIKDFIDVVGLGSLSCTKISPAGNLNGVLLPEENSKMMRMASSYVGLGSDGVVHKDVDNTVKVCNTKHVGGLSFSITNILQTCKQQRVNRSGSLSEVVMNHIFGYNNEVNCWKVFGIYFSLMYNVLISLTI